MVLMLLLLYSFNLFGAGECEASLKHCFKGAMGLIGRCIASFGADVVLSVGSSWAAKTIVSNGKIQTYVFGPIHLKAYFAGPC